MLQCVAVRCSVLQCVYLRTLEKRSSEKCVAMCCSVLQCVAVCLLENIGEALFGKVTITPEVQPFAEIVAHSVAEGGRKKKRKREKKEKGNANVTILCSSVLQCVGSVWAVCCSVSAVCCSAYSRSPHVAIDILLNACFFFLFSFFSFPSPLCPS